MPLLQWIRRQGDCLLDLFLPPCCALCGISLSGQGRGEALCPACLAGITPLAPPHCPRCALPFATAGGSDHLCEACSRRPPPFAWVGVAGLYAGTLRQAVHRFKFGGRLDLDRPLAALITRAAAAAVDDFAADVVMAVPLHSGRLRERGCNQSLLLAGKIGRRLGVPVVSRELVRIKATTSQQGLPEPERRRNLRGAFAVRGCVRGRRVLLVDDVVTTCATVEECARTLRAAGAREVAVLAAARAPRLNLLSPPATDSRRMP